MKPQHPQNTYKNQQQESESTKKTTDTGGGVVNFLRNNRIKLLTTLAFMGATGATVSTLTNSCSVTHNTPTIELNENNDSIVNAKYIEFGHFLETQDLGKIDRATTLGRYVRICRYSDHIKEAADKEGIPFEYLFALIMVESQGNTASINENDGGAGFIHFQPDVAKEYGMKIFTDNKKYKKYDFEVMQDAGKTKKEIYKKHGKVLQDIIDGAGMAELEKLDDRFHTTKCINATAKYLAKIKKNVDKKKNEKCGDDSWDVYKNDTIYNFDRMLTLNGFNKGPNRFDVGFADGNHIKNIKHNLEMMRKYEAYVKDMFKKNKSNEEVFKGLQTTKFL